MLVLVDHLADGEVEFHRSTVAADRTTSSTGLRSGSDAGPIGGRVSGRRADEIRCAYLPDMKRYTDIIAEALTRVREPRRPPGRPA